MLPRSPGSNTLDHILNRFGNIGMCTAFQPILELFLGPLLWSWRSDERSEVLFAREVLTHLSARAWMLLMSSRITPRFIFYAISYKIIRIPHFSLIITTFFNPGRSFNFYINIEQFFLTLFQISRYHRHRTSDIRSRSTLRNHKVVYLHSPFLTGFGSSFRANHNNIATVLASATSQSSLTIPADAMAAIAKLGTGGANATTLSARWHRSHLGMYCSWASQ